MARVRSSVRSRLDQSAHRLAAVTEAFRQEPAVRLDLFRSNSRGPGSDRDIAHRSWELPGLAADYARFLDDHRPLLGRLRRAVPVAEAALVERVRLVHGYRHFPFRDPDLPPELLPSDWPGHDAHAVFVECHILRGPAVDFVDAVLGRRELGFEGPRLQDAHGTSCDVS